MPWAVGALLATLLLSGCQAEETPPAGAFPSVSSGSPSASPASTSPSPSASPSSEIPAAAREKSQAGAEAFVRYFVKQSAHAWISADPNLITALSDPDCKSCASLASTAAQLRERGHRYADLPISVVSVDALTGDEQRQNVAATIDQRAVNVVDSDGNIVSSDQADSLERTFLLYWEGSGWRVGGIA